MTRKAGEKGGTLHYFSDARRDVAPPAATPQVRSGPTESKTVLVVDDQHVVLELVDAFLENSDYRVYLASDGQQALEISRRLRGRVDLLLTDVRMPGMNGPELYQRLLASSPGAKVLYMSGFSASESGRFGVPEGAPLVVKPFRPDDLKQRIRLVIAGVLEFTTANSATRHI